MRRMEAIAIKKKKKKKNINWIILYIATMADIITVSSSDDECIPPPKKKIRPVFLGEITPQVTITRVKKVKKTKTAQLVSPIEVHELLSDDDEVVSLTNEVNDENCLTIDDDVEKVRIDDSSEGENCKTVENGKSEKIGVTGDIDVIEDLKVIENVQVVEYEISNESSQDNSNKAESSRENSDKEESLQDNSDKEESSGKENKTENELSTITEPSTSTSCSRTPNTLLLDEFLIFIQDTIKNTKFERLESKIPILRKYYGKCEENLGESLDFKQMLENNFSKAKKSLPLAVISFNEIHQYLKEIVDAESIEVPPETRIKLKKLEKTIKLLVAKIKSLEEAEINFDDEEDSTYIQLDRYTNRLQKVHHKYCELLEKNPYSGRLTYSKLDFSDSEYNEINRAISKKYKNNKKFPSYMEMENFIKKISEENDLDLSDSKIKAESIHCFKKLGELLQNRRRRELYDSHHMIIKDNDDPANNDSVLNSTLTEQYLEGQNKIEKIVQEYVNKQQHGVEVELSDESSDKSNYVDSEDGADDDVENMDAAT